MDKGLLQQCALFADLEATELNVLLKSAVAKTFEGGATIYERGEPSQGFFGLILSGRVGVFTESGQIIRGMGEAEVIGEVGVTSPQRKRTASVVAIEPTEILEWNFPRIEKQTPQLLKKLKDLAWKNVSNYY